MIPDRPGLPSVASKIRNIPPHHQSYYTTGSPSQQQGKVETTARRLIFGENKGKIVRGVVEGGLLGKGTIEREIGAPDYRSEAGDLEQ